MTLALRDASTESVNRAEAPERRREFRYPCDDPAEVRLVPGDGSRQSARVLEISRSGMRLEVPLSVAKGSQIEVFLPKQLVIFGQVRYCRRAGAKYHAGVLIEEAFYSRSVNGEHASDMQIQSYLAGHGLTLPQVIAVRDHLSQCEGCRRRMDIKTAGPSKVAPPGAR
jgi:hypothetical protein